MNYCTPVRAVERTITEPAEQGIDERLARVRVLEQRQALEAQLCKFIVVPFSLRLR